VQIPNWGMFVERLVPVAAVRLEVAALGLVASTSISRLANSSARVLQVGEKNLLPESGTCGDRSRLCTAWRKPIVGVDQ
jgi:hypothetical protein